MTAPAAAGNDKVQLYGILGIVGAICCPILGLVFAILCLMEAKKYGKPPTLAYIAFGVLVLGIILNIFLFSSGLLFNMGS